MFNKTAYKFILKDHMRSVIVFYSILVAVYILIGISLLRTSVTGQGTLGGMDVATFIFLLVSGLVSFRESFLMLSQNSVSRKTMFITRLAATLTLAGIMAVADKALLLLGKVMFSGKSNLHMESLFEQIYANQQITDNVFALQMLMLVFNFLFYLCLFTVGFFISISFYRSNKTGRVALGAGIPVSLFFLLPLLDGLVFNGRLTVAIANTIDFAMGISSNNPIAALISCSLGFVVLSGLSWLVMRRATVKG